MNHNQKTTEEVFASITHTLEVPSRAEFITMMNSVTKSSAGRNTVQSKRSEKILSPFGWLVRHRSFSFTMGTLISVCAIVGIVIIPKTISITTTSPVVSLSRELVADLTYQADDEQSLTLDQVGDEIPVEENDVLLQEI
jgi:hypothetical protein